MTVATDSAVSESCAYTVERKGSSIAEGWRLRVTRGQVDIHTGVFTPNGLWQGADRIARDQAHTVGKEWLSRFDQEIPF